MTLRHPHLVALMAELMHVGCGKPRNKVQPDKLKISEPRQTSLASTMHDFINVGSFCIRSVFILCETIGEGVSCVPHHRQLSVPGHPARLGPGPGSVDDTACTPSHLHHFFI